MKARLRRLALACFATGALLALVSYASGPAELRAQEEGPRDESIGDGPIPGVDDADDAAASDRQDASGRVLRLNIEGPITPAAMERLSRAIEAAEARNAEALLVVLDTPGGLVSSMDEMIRDILSARVPVLTYVYPPGSAAGSAGVYIMYASHVAAMAPGTNIGSATPVSMGGPGGGAPGGEAPQEKEQPGLIPEEAGADDAVNMKRKQLNHAVAQIRSLAQYHGRNEQFAERSITRAENITSQEALQQNVIDVLAESPRDLLRKVEGRSVRMLAGTQRLALADAPVELLESDFRNDILALISHPSVAMILMMIGMLGIMSEVFYSPGAIFPGAVGALCLILGLYSMQTLPVNYTGLALLGLGFIFFVLEFYVMSYGLLSIAGVVSLVLGSLMMMRSGEEFIGMSASAIIAVSLVTGVAMAALVWLALRSQTGKQVTGYEQLFQEVGEARTEINQQSGTVFLHSELWSARTKNDETIEAGAPVQAVDKQGLTLYVTRARPQGPSSGIDPQQGY